MHKSGATLSNQKKTVTFRCEVENAENVETGSINNLSVSGIKCVDKTATESCGFKASKTYVGVDSNKHSSVRSEEEISNDFVNQMLFESIAFVIDDIEKDVECCLGSPSEPSEKTGKDTFLKPVDKETNDPCKKKLL